MYVDRLSPANGGVVVDVDTFLVVDDAHLHGTVVEAGGGVRWLGPGSRVAFPRKNCTGFEVLTRLVPPHLLRAQGGAQAPNDRTTLYLVDQRDIHAVLDDESAPAVGKIAEIGRAL